MTPRENLLALLAGEKPEWIPIVGHCDPYNQPSKRGMPADLAPALADVKWGDESTIAFSRHLGIDVADWFGAPIAERQRTIKPEVVKNPNEIMTTWRTSHGLLRQVQRYSASTRLWYTAEHMVKSPGDLPALAELFEDKVYEPRPDAAEIVAKRKKLIGDDGILLFSWCGTPLGQLVRVHAGVEATAFLWADARAQLHQTLAVMESAHRRYTEMAAAMDGDVIVSVDDTSTTTISPAMFEECCLGYVDRMVEVVHAAGKFYFHHSCGLIRDLLPLYRRTKMDAVHAFTIPPIGNVEIGEGRHRLGPDIMICAGLVQIFGDMSDRPAVAASVERMFEQARPGRRISFWLAADPEHTVDDAAFIVDVCRRRQRDVQ